MNNYHPYITGANRMLNEGKGLNVFGPGTDPAGLGTLGAPVNPAHLIDYLGENLPPFGNPNAIVGADANRWEEDFEDAYSGKIVTEERDRFSPNTTTYTISDANPFVSRPDELTEVKNNAQILAEKTQLSVRTYRANPQADALANQVSADAEMRNFQNDVVGLVYESQMDALRAKHLAARARGTALRGESIGALPVVSSNQVSFMAPSSLNLRAKPTAQKQVMLPGTSPNNVISAPASASPAGSMSTGSDMDFMSMTMGSSDDQPIVDDSMLSDSYVDTRFEPTKVALVLGGVAVAAIAAALFLRRK